MQSYRILHVGGVKFSAFLNVHLSFPTYPFHGEKESKFLPLKCTIFHYYPSLKCFPMEESNFLPLKCKVGGKSSSFFFPYMHRYPSSQILPHMWKFSSQDIQRYLSPHRKQERSYAFFFNKQASILHNLGKEIVVNKLAPPKCKHVLPYRSFSNMGT